MAGQEQYPEKIKELAALIRRGKKVYALTGAGCSTESGLPDFRSPGSGLWEKIDPMEYSTAGVLCNDPESFYKFGFPRFRALSEACPNAGHYALAKLEKLGYIAGLITQNIDGLHFKAGSEQIWEVHGHLRTASCISCGAVFPFPTLLDKLDGGEIPPRCPCGGMIRPDVILFGDPMSHPYFEAERVLQSGCDLMLAIGTSLSVYPVAGLPRLARRLAIINLQPTPYDREAEVVIRRTISGVLTDLVGELTKDQ